MFVVWQVILDRRMADYGQNGGGTPGKEKKSKVVHDWKNFCECVFEYKEKGSFLIVRTLFSFNNSFQISTNIKLQSFHQVVSSRYTYMSTKQHVWFDPNYNPFLIRILCCILPHRSLSLSLTHMYTLPAKVFELGPTYEQQEEGQGQRPGFRCALYQPSGPLTVRFAQPIPPTHTQPQSQSGLLAEPPSWQPRRRSTTAANPKK